MTTITPPARTNTLHSPPGVTLAASEATALAAGNTISYQNTGNVVLRIVGTTAGTGVVQGLLAGNNINITIAVGDNLFGPYDPGLYGQTVNITTATAVGSVATYQMANRYNNGLHNPFETNPLAPDA